MVNKKDEFHLKKIINVIVNGVKAEVVSSFSLISLILDNRLSIFNYAVSIC